MLTTQGYERPTYDDILDNLILKAQELFGEDIETNEQTPLGKFLRIRPSTSGGRSGSNILRTISEHGERHKP